MHLCLEPRFDEKHTSSYAAKQNTMKFRLLLGLVTEIRLSRFRSMAPYHDILAVPAKTMSFPAADVDQQSEMMRAMAPASLQR